MLGEKEQRQRCRREWLYSDRVAKELHNHQFAYTLQYGRQLTGEEVFAGREPPRVYT